jgi:hypothetical protein
LKKADKIRDIKQALLDYYDKYNNFDEFVTNFDNREELLKYIAINNTRKRIGSPLNIEPMT